MKRTMIRKFSILELITVIAIVMTLISLLVTSIKSSKDMAVQVSCMSNISQIRIYTELYRKDHKQLPYSNIWLTDFSHVTAYMPGGGTEQELDVFICPGSKDSKLSSAEQLKYNTSYYYVPGRTVLEANIGDGQAYGFNLLNLAALSSMYDMVIYDKSPDHHNGKINVAYLHDSGQEKQGQILAETAENFLVLDGSGQLVLTDADSYGTININPNNADGNLFTLTDRDGNVITVRDGETGMGTATSITIQVKNSDRTMTIDGEEYTFKTNQTYTITATGGEGIDPYYIYSLTQEGSGTGQWYIELFQGVGSITITDESGSSTTINGNGNSSK